MRRTWACFLPMMTAQTMCQTTVPLIDLVNLLGVHLASMRARIQLPRWLQLNGWMCC